MRGYTNGQFRTYVCMYVCNNFTIYTITQNILERSAPIFFAETLGALGQREFVRSWVLWLYQKYAAGGSMRWQYVVLGGLLTLLTLMVQ